LLLGHLFLRSSVTKLRVCVIFYFPSLNFLAHRWTFSKASLCFAELPGVRWVLPDSYLDVKNKDYGGTVYYSSLVFFFMLILNLFSVPLDCNLFSYCHGQFVRSLFQSSALYSSAQLGNLSLEVLLLVGNCFFFLLLREGGGGNSSSQIRHLYISIITLLLFHDILVNPKLYSLNVI
jgi:hypothetical protein